MENPLENRNPLTERWLNGYGIEPEYIPEFQLAKIKPDTYFQIRENEYDEEWVKARVEAVKEGAMFPPLVLQRTGMGHFHLVDGRNRREVLRRIGTEHYAVYIVNVDTATYHRLCAEANMTLNGRQLNEDELRAAVTQMTDDGFTYQQIHTSLGITRTRLLLLVNLDRSIKRCATIGFADAEKLVRAWSEKRLSTPSFVALCGVHRDEDFKSLATAIVRHNPPATAVAKAVKAIREATTDDEVAAALRQLTHRSVAPGRHGHGPETRLKMVVGQFRHTLPTLTRLTTADERTEAASVLEDLRSEIDKTLLVLLGDE